MTIVRNTLLKRFHNRKGKSLTCINFVGKKESKTKHIKGKKQATDQNLIGVFTSQCQEQNPRRVGMLKDALTIVSVFMDYLFQLILFLIMKYKKIANPAKERFFSAKTADE